MGKLAEIKAKPRTKQRVRIFPPVPKGFDAVKATSKELRRYGLPLRPDPFRDPGLTALWDQHVLRYREFQHLQASIIPAGPVFEPPTSPFGLYPPETCAYELISLNAPITTFSGRWTVPNLHYGPALPSRVFFRTFFGLGFLDVHVEMTVDVSDIVTARITIHTGAVINLAVKPGDTISATLCLQTNSAGTATYFLANETTSQRLNLTIETGFPPAVTINAGISRGAIVPNNPLAGFGTVYFDELIAYTTKGSRLLTDGTAISMTDGGSTLARPFRISDFAFKIVPT